MSNRAEHEITVHIGQSIRVSAISVFAYNVKISNFFRHLFLFLDAGLVRMGIILKLPFNRYVDIISFFCMGLLSGTHMTPVWATRM